MIPTILCMVLILTGAATALAGTQQGAPTTPAPTQTPAAAEPPAPAKAPVAPVSPEPPAPAQAPAAPEPPVPAKAPAAKETTAATACLQSGDGYFRARLG